MNNPLYEGTAIFCLLSVSPTATADVNILDEFFPEAGAFYVMDQGYLDFARLFVFTLCSAFFIIRTKLSRLQSDIMMMLEDCLVAPL